MAKNKKVAGSEIMATDFFGIWKCSESGCDNEVRWTYYDMVECGNPVCGVCSADMVFTGDTGVKENK